jgi:hypothetical protein
LLPGPARRMITGSRRWSLAPQRSVLVQRCAAGVDIRVGEHIISAIPPMTGGVVVPCLRRRQLLWRPWPSVRDPKYRRVDRDRALSMMDTWCGISGSVRADRRRSRSMIRIRKTIPGRSARAVPAGYHQALALRHARMAFVVQARRLLPRPGKVRYGNLIPGSPLRWDGETVFLRSMQSLRSTTARVVGRGCRCGRTTIPGYRQTSSLTAVGSPARRQRR